MRVTKIERQKKHPARKSVFLDGNFAFGISDDVLLKHGLHEGAELTPAEAETIQKAEGEETAKQKALRYLAIRPRSRKEIRDYLSKKEYTEEVAATVIHRLEELKLLDDAEFARMVCRDMIAKKPAGEKLLRQSLVRKGVPKPLIDTILPEFFTPESELALALKAAEKQQARMERSSRRIDETRSRKKIVEYLVRHGFNYETALKATRTVTPNDP